MKKEIKYIVDYLFNEHGLDISIYEDSFLQMSVERRITATGSKTFGDYFHLLQNNRNEVQDFFNSLHNTFTEFFRNPLTYAYIKQIILPSLITQKLQSGEKEIRIWSAACSSGEEAFSMAMLFDEITEVHPEKISCRIFATDISTSNLESGKKGIFSEDAISKLSLARVKKYFIQKGNNYQVVSQLKEFIDFSVFDLLADQRQCPPASIFGNFDMVFCSNLLFYYRQSYRERILDKAGSCLALDGFIICGETERDILKKHNYREVSPGSAIFKKKTRIRVS